MKPAHAATIRRMRSFLNSGMISSITQDRRRPARSPAGKHMRPARAATIRRMRSLLNSGMISSITQDRRQLARKAVGKPMKPVLVVTIRPIKRLPHLDMFMSTVFVSVVAQLIRAGSPIRAERLSILSTVQVIPLPESGQISIHR